MEYRGTKCRANIQVCGTKCRANIQVCGSTKCRANIQVCGTKCRANIQERGTKCRANEGVGAWDARGQRRRYPGVRCPGQQS
eukprot:892182-Rhodomonas_salina.1